jgi:hypothetical protein
VWSSSGLSADQAYYASFNNANDRMESQSLSDKTGMGALCVRGAAPRTGRKTVAEFQAEAAK